MGISFQDMLAVQAQQGKFLCVGLDLDATRRPNFEPQGSITKRTFEYGKMIVLNTRHYAAAYKFNIGFYLAHGTQGMRALETLIAQIRNLAPGVPIIADQKANDIGLSSEQYAKAYFEEFEVDAVTLNPYMGKDSLQPFLDYSDKGCIVLCKTSNAGSGEFQDRCTGLTQDERKRWAETRRPTDDMIHANFGWQLVPQYQLVAFRVSEYYNHHKNCGLVVGATYPEDVARVRVIAGDDVLILAPGVGKQQGDLAATVQAAKNSQGRGFLVNVSSDIAYAPVNDTFYGAVAMMKAREYHEAIQAALGIEPVRESA